MTKLDGGTTWSLRGEPRDVLDLDAAPATARYTHARLLELAEQADAGVA